MIDRANGLGHTGLTRRTFLRGSALAGAGAFIAACAGGATPAPATNAAPTPKTVTGPLKFANWTAYVDLAGAAGEEGAYEPGSSPTLEAFKSEYSVEIDYVSNHDAPRTGTSGIHARLFADPSSLPTTRPLTL